MSIASFQKYQNAVGAFAFMQGARVTRGVLEANVSMLSLFCFSIGIEQITMAL